VESPAVESATDVLPSTGVSSPVAGSTTTLSVAKPDGRRAAALRIVDDD
jgi:hypothetical protein